MNGIVRVTTNELLSERTQYPCTWIGWYYQNPHLSQLVHVYYSCHVSQPPTVTWNMSLRNLCEIENVKLVEIYPMEIHVSKLLPAITKQYNATTGWDLVQSQLDNITPSMGMVLTLSSLKWETYYTREFKSLPFSDILLSKYIPAKEDISHLRMLIDSSSSPELVEAFNRCFPTSSLEKPDWVSEDDASDENLESLIYYYECFPQYDSNQSKMKLLKDRLAQRK